MATTEHFYAGTGTQTSFPFEFPYLTESDVFVALYNSSTGNFDIKQQNTSGQNNDYSISNTNIVFNTAPPQIAGVNNIHIFRNTDVETAKAVYGTGSAIRAQDLNENNNQSLYKLQEGAQLINTEDIKDEAINSAKIKDGTIVNADVSPNAEIAVSKLADGSARQLLETDTTGTGVQWASNIQIPGTLDIIGNTTAHSDLSVSNNLTVANNFNVDGTSTIDQAATFASTVGIGGQTTINAHLDVNAGASINDVQIGVAGNNEITTAGGNLELDSASGTTRVDDDLVVTGSITAPTWNGNHIDTFWLTNKQHINHIGETITLAKSSTGTGNSFQVSNADHRFTIAKDYTFEVGHRVNEGVDVGTLNTIGLKPCLEVKHLINIQRVTKLGSAGYTTGNTDEQGFINFGTAQSSWIGSNQNLGNTNIQHAHLVLSGIRGQSSNTAITNPNNYCPTVVISGQRGVMFTHPDNTSYSYYFGGNPNNTIYSGLNQLAKGAHTQGAWFPGDDPGIGNNGYADASEALALFEGAVDFQIIVGGARAKNRFEIGSSTVAGTLSLSGTDVTATSLELNKLDGYTGTTTELNKLDGFTGSTTDLNEVVAGKNVVEQITSSAADTELPTAQAVNERIVELVTEVGGFHPIADETSFPTDNSGNPINPDINDGAGTIVSLKALNSAFSTGSGVTTHTFTNGAGSGNNVIINGLPESTTFQAGKGLILETTSTLSTYNYHRLVLDESGVSNADALVSAFNERYYGPHAANQATRPSGANRLNGDLYFNTSDGKMKVFNGSHATGTWDDVAAPGNFFINTLSSSSGSGGGQSAFNNIATRFTLSNPPLTAQQLLVSVNGVIQKPNSGTSPSEGFAIDGADIIFASAPATGAPFFIVTIGSSVNIGTPSNDTVGAAQIIDGSISNAEISSSAAIAKSKLASLDIVDADVNASAAIAGSKINPSFINTVQITNNSPNIKFVDSNNNSDFRIIVNDGQLKIQDTTNSNTTRFFIDSNGTVDVVGNLDVGAGVDVTGILTVTDASGSDPTMQINHSDADVTGEFIRVGRTDLPAIRYHSIKATHSGGAAANKISFNIHNGSTTTSQAEVLTILGDGNIGINVASPSGVLHAYKATGTQRSYFESGDSHSFIRLLGGSASHNSGIEFFSGSSTNTANITALSTGSLVFDTGSTNDALTINSSGAVGIGTTSPSYKLEVIGGTNGLYALGSATTATSLTFGNSASHILRCESSELAVGLHNASPFNLYLQGRTSANAARSISINPLGGDVSIGSNDFENIPLHACGQTGQTTILKLKSAESTVNQQWQNNGNGNCLHQYDGLSFNTYTPSASGTLELQHQINHHGITLTQGKGINFHNYGQGTNIDKNKFDDYEEGTWDVTFQYWNGSAWDNVSFDTSPSHTTGTYTKIGNTVFFAYYSGAFNINTGANSAAAIAGLPFQCDSMWTAISVTHADCFTGSGENGAVNASTTRVRFFAEDSSNNVYWKTSTGYIMIAGTYRV